MYNKVLIILSSLIICSTGFSQQKNAAIAPFKITLVDGKTYTANQLKKNTPTVLIYFSPDCDHCKNFTAELLKRKSELKNKQIVMVTYLPVSEIKPFDSLYHISSIPNFKIGTEGYTFTVRKYYDVQRFPFIVLYDKQMKLIKILSPSDKPEVLAKQVASL